MKISLKKDSEFRQTRFPWVIYYISLAITVITIIFKTFTLQNSGTISLIANIILFAAGIGIGVYYVNILQKKITSKREYVACKSGMVVVWVTSYISIIITLENANWMYSLGNILVGISVGFFFLYLPRYITTKIELNNLVRDLKSEK